MAINNTLFYDLDRVLESLYDALYEVQRERNMEDEQFLREAANFFDEDIIEGYKDWMDIDD